MSRPGTTPWRRMIPLDHHRRQSLAELRKQASRPGRAIDGGPAFTAVRDNVLLALLDVTDAAVGLATWGSCDPGSVAIHKEHRDAISAFHNAVNALGDVAGVYPRRERLDGGPECRRVYTEPIANPCECVDGTCAMPGLVR